MPGFSLIQDYRTGYGASGYKGLFMGAQPPRLHSAKRPRMTINRAFINSFSVGRVRSTGHDVEVTEHRMLSVIFPMSGSLETRFKDRAFRVKPGQALIAGRGARETRVTRSADGPFLGLVILFDQIDLAKFARETVSKTVGDTVGGDVFDVCNVSGMSQARHLRQLTTMLCDDLDDRRLPPMRFESEVSWQNLIVEKLVSVIAENAGHSINPPIQSERHASRHVRLAVDHMLACYGEIETIADVALACGVSTRTLEIAFQKVVGRTPFSVLSDIRLEQARRLLTAEDGVTVAAAAYAVGFGHSGRFSKAYAQMFGELPSITLARRGF